MKRVSKVANLGWRRRYFAAAALTLAAVCVLFGANALGDAGNPILGTIKGELVTHPDGSVTVYVRGQWNWISHSSDCNTDRAGAGVGLIWNDPTEPGYTVAKGSISAGVGIKELRKGGDSVNTIDQMVHPSDLGNIAEGYPGFTGQTFNNPTPADPNSYKTWKGGCGREPLTATESPGPGAAANPSGEPCANGTTTCSKRPWGSWGYQPALNDGSGQGYKHTYAKRSDLTTVCVNFYDVHGGGTGSKLQLVNGAKEITDNGNGDNSIQTNAFNPAQGANCVEFPVSEPKLVTHASAPVTIGESISDTATLSGGSSPTGSITFKVYAPKADGTADTGCSTLVGTLGPITVNGNGDYSSGPFTPSGSVTEHQIAGTYEWTASYSGDANNAPATTACNDTGEQSVVNKYRSSVPTGQKLLISDYARVTATSGTPTGSVTFKLFTTEDCSGTPLFNRSEPLESGLAHVDDPTPLSADGTYSWLVTYGGSGNFGSAVSQCTESTTIKGNTPGVDP